MRNLDVPIKSVIVTTGGLENFVTPGFKSEKQVTVNVYPARYSRRIEVRGTAQDKFLHYLDNDGNRCESHRVSRDVPLSQGRLSKVELKFDMRLEHASFEEEAGICGHINHEIETKTTSRAIVQHAQRALGGVTSPRATVSTVVRCNGVFNG